MKRLILTTSVAIALIHAISGAQQTTFRSSVDFVELDAFVTDSRGTFLTDLTADDFEILDDGQPQTISSFLLVDLPLPSPTPAASKMPELDVTTNAGNATERLWVMLLDAPDIYRGPEYTRRTQNVARGFIESTGLNDSVAIIHVQGSQRASQPLTTSRARLFESIERFSQGVGSGNPIASEQERSTRVRTTFEIIEDVSKRLGAISSRRKAIVWIGGQLPFDLAGTSQALPFAYRDMIRTAQRNHVAIYSIDASVMGNNPLTYQGALRAISEDTGGIAITNTNNLTRGFREIVRDNSTYYLLGFYPNPLHRDGEFHRITVRTRRPGLTVRARPGYLAPTAATAPPAPPTSIDELNQALRNPVPRRDVSIEVAATPIGSTKAAGAVLLTASARSEPVAASDTSVDVAVRVINAEGETLAERATRYPLVGGANDAGGVAVRFTDRIDLPKGRHEIRVAMNMPGGKTGSVVTYADVPNFKENRVSLSGLSVESPTTRGIPVFAGKGSEPSDTTVITERRFPSSTTLRVSCAVYGKSDGSENGLTVTALLKDESGMAVRENLPVSIEPSGRVAQERFATVQVALAGLRPGAYTLVINAGTARNRRPAATRVLPLWVVQP